MEAINASAARRCRRVGRSRPPAICTAPLSCTRVRGSVGTFSCTLVSSGATRCATGSAPLTSGSGLVTALKPPETKMPASIARAAVRTGVMARAYPMKLGETPESRRLRAQVPAEVRHGEGDRAALSRVDEALLDQCVPGRRERGRLAVQRPGHVGGGYRLALGVRYG